MEDQIETEVKIALSVTAGDMAARLYSLGFEESAARFFEDNYLLDLPGNFFQKKGCSLRVRLMPGTGELTFKGTPQSDALFKVREEINTRVQDPENLLMILKKIGFQIYFRYQKYRTVLKKDRLLVMLDETPLGDFIEFEGDKADILRAAAALDFPKEAFIIKSYLQLHKDRCLKAGRPFGDLVFPADGGEKRAE
jgi:adenylate cyclase class 2